MSAGHGSAAAAASPGERLRELLMSLNDYSNSKILEISSFIVSHGDEKHRFEPKFQDIAWSSRPKLRIFFNTRTYS
jgi:hypothetical protein